jgi:hypothetical protein
VAIDSGSTTNQIYETRGRVGQVTAQSASFIIIKNQHI